MCKLKIINMKLKMIKSTRGAGEGQNHISEKEDSKQF